MISHHGSAPGSAPTFRSDENGRMRALHRLQALDAAPEEAFENLVSLVKAVFGVPICAISLVDAHRQFFLAERGLDTRETGRDLSICSHAIARPEPLVVADATCDPRFARNALVTGAPHIRSYAGMPLMTSDGYQVGALCVIDQTPRDFTRDELALLRKFADNVVHELELRMTAFSDELTSALSRRGWMKVAETAFDHARARGEPLCVAILDIDLFKAVNDRHGHAVGDQVLKAFALTCWDHLRGPQRFGRIGGEEFALLMPRATAEAAMREVDSLRRAFAQLSHAADALSCTVSIGVAEHEAADETLDSLLSRADVALYEAKRGGRDRCVLARPGDAAVQRAFG